MARYRLDTYHYRHARKFFRRVKILSAVLILILVIGGAVILIDSLFQEKQAVTPTDTTVETKTSFFPADQIFRTAYFQFQTPKGWIAVTDASTGNKFVYRSMEKTLVRQELDIYVNSPPINEAVTRVLPVEVAGNSLDPKDVSPQCGTTLPKNNTNRSPQTITLSNIQFTCIPDSNEYKVLVGLSNGNTSLNLQRPGGTTGNYQLLYNNVTVNPDPRDLIGIVESFQTR